MKQLLPFFFLRCLCGAGLLLGAALWPVAGAQATLADTARIAQALAQARAAIRTDTSFAGRTTRRALAESKQAGYTEGAAEAFLLLGQAQAIRGDYARALTLYHRDEQLLTAQYRTRPTQQLRTNLSLAANGIGGAERERGNLKASIVAYLRAIDYSTAAQDYDGLVVLYSNLSGCFAELGQADKQLDYLRLSIALRPQLRHPEQLMAPYLSLALFLMAHDRQSEAGRYLEQARQLLALPGAARYRADYERAQGAYFFQAGRYVQAQASFGRALREVQRAGNGNHAAELYQALGLTANQLGNEAGASTHLAHGLALARTQHNAPLEARLLESLAELEESRGAGHAPAALAYFKQFKAVKDRLEGEKTKRTILRLETQYRTRQQAQQIQALHAQRAVQQQALQRKTWLSYAAFALVGVLLGAVALAATALRARQKLAAQQQQLQARQLEELEQERQLLATEAMLNGQDAERSRIARDLHDGLGGMLSTVKYYLGTVRSQVAFPDAPAQLFARSLVHLDNSISELRRVAHDMMPEALQLFGLVPALQDVCEAVGHRQQLQVQLLAYGLDERLPQRTEVVVYRLVQELLNNALKHADAQQIIVQLTRNGAQVQVVVEDDGRGFDSTTASSGMGLRSIQSRVDYLRGTLDLHSHPGQGTTATIEFTLPHA